MQQRCHAEQRAWSLPHLGTCASKGIAYRGLIWALLSQLKMSCYIKVFSSQASQATLHFRITVTGTCVWCSGARVKCVLSSAAWGDQEQTLTPCSTRIQNAISGCVVVLRHARLISPCGDQGYNWCWLPRQHSPQTVYTLQRSKSIQRTKANTMKWPCTLISFLRPRLYNKTHKGAIQWTRRNTH